MLAFKAVTLAPPTPELCCLKMETHMVSDFSMSLDNISKIQTVSQIGRFEPAM